MKVEVAVRNGPYGLCGRKATLKNRAQELCEGRGGRPGLSVAANSPYGLCGRKATLNWNRRAKRTCGWLPARDCGVLPVHAVVSAQRACRTVQQSYLAAPTLDIVQPQRRSRGACPVAGVSVGLGCRPAHSTHHCDHAAGCCLFFCAPPSPQTHSHPTTLAPTTH